MRIFELFRRDIIGRADDRAALRQRAERFAGMMFARQDARDAHVEDFDMSRLAIRRPARPRHDHHVRGFDIAMHQPLFMARARRPSAAWRRKSTASGYAIGPCCSTWRSSVTPATYSMTR